MAAGISVSDHCSLTVDTIYWFRMTSRKKKITHPQVVHNGHRWGLQTFCAWRNSHISGIVLNSVKELVTEASDHDLHTVRALTSMSEVHASIALQRQQIKSSLMSVLK